MIDRRSFLLAGAAAGMACRMSADREPDYAAPAYEAPLLDFSTVKAPVRIESIELLRAGKEYFVRATGGGLSGVVRTKQVEHYIPILLDLVIPHFIGGDARDLEALIDLVYTKNYKISGQAFWCPVAYVEQSLLDLLGRVAGKPAGSFFGPVTRTEIPVYLSGSGRETTAEEEVDVYVRGVQATGAKAVKFKIGGRMSRNADATPGRTAKLLDLARRKLGDGIVLYADANGSYDARKGIEIGRQLEKLGFQFFEEPCPWEELTETKKVADALDIPVAGGECDHSLWRYQYMVEQRVVDIVQPDLNYNGGLIRAARVARMAREAGLPITPHNTQTGASSGNILQFASVIPNTGPYMEYPWRRPPKQESWFTPHFDVAGGAVPVPKGPGLGVEIDPDYLRKAERIAT
ncbi:MAG: mandelate racemase/muconate lactonizing enzyme family protein [Bryobacterales bacterium]|nr:mandelate racemase/muconate lactonizing enzyme family protein [Bryobacterales bacterium]